MLNVLVSLSYTFGIWDMSGKNWDLSGKNNVDFRI